MNRSAIGVLVSTTMLVALLVIGCGQQPLEPVSQLPPTTPPTLIKDPASDQAMLEEMKMAARRAIGEYTMLARPVPDCCYAALQSIEEAQQSLRELEEERQTFLPAINHYRSMARPVPDEVAAALSRIDDTRVTVIRSLGLD